MNDQILQEIGEFCRQRGLAESTFGRRAVNDGARVEAVLRTKYKLQAATLSDLNGALDNYVQLFRRVPLPDDDLARTIITDVERCHQLIEFVLQQAIERRISGIKALHQIAIARCSGSSTPSRLPLVDVRRGGPDTRFRTDILCLERGLLRASARARIEL